MKTNRPKLRTAGPRLFLPVLLLTGLPLWGQEAQTGDESVFELSPFTVSTSSDSGYIAGSTLAGSRLNTSLGDTSAPISVFTKELLQDLAANDTQTATFYSVSADEFVEAEIGDQAGNQLQNDGLQFNIRGFKTTATRNYFPWGLNTDNYNADRLDFSRGPNSILYGLGSPGGVVNTSTKQAQMTDLYQAELQASSWSGLRGAIDINKEIIDQKLAVRFNGMMARKESWRNNRFKDEERMHLTGTFRPFARTTIRAEFETGNIDQVKPRPWGPLDGFSAWVAAGSPTVDTARGEIPDGASSVGGGTRLTIDQSGSALSIVDWTGMARSDPGNFNYAIFDFSVVPRKFDAIGPGSRIDNDYETASVFIEQEILENLFVELAYNKQVNQAEENRPINWNAPLYVDINAQLPDGSVNPNFGRYFVEDSYRGFRFDNETEILRATASYELDFAKVMNDNIGKWLGRHRLAGLYQNQKDDNRRFNFRELNATPIVPSTNWTAASNRIYRRTYIDLDAGIGVNGQASPQDNPVAPQTVTTVGGATGIVTPAFLPDSFSGSIVDLETRMGALQSYFWDGRIVTTYGRREDTQKSRGASVTNENRIITGYTFDQPYGDERSGITETMGVVFHALDWMSVFYNTSESFNLGNPTRVTLDGKPVGDEQGTGDDYGIRFQLLDDRFFITLARYETASENRLTFNAEGNVQDAADAIWEVVDPSRLSGSGLIASTEDLVSEGYEFEVVANPTKNWQLIGNVSKSTTETTNLFSRNRAYVESNRAEWLANSPVEILGSTNYTTVGEAVAFIDNEIATRVDPFNGQVKLGHSDWKMSLFTNYTFAEDTPLGGFSVGGGLRYVSEPVIGYSAPVPGVAATQYEGSDNTVVDLKIGYKTTLFEGRVDWAIQLNVRNLLDEDDILLTLADTDGNPRRYRFQEPREWVITTTFKF